MKISATSIDFTMTEPYRSLLLSLPEEILLMIVRALVVPSKRRIMSRDTGLGRKGKFMGLPTPQPHLISLRLVSKDLSQIALPVVAEQCFERLTVMIAGDSLLDLAYDVSRHPAFQHAVKHIILAPLHIPDKIAAYAYPHGDTDEMDQVSASLTSYRERSAKLTSMPWIIRENCWTILWISLQMPSCSFPIWNQSGSYVRIICPERRS